MAEAQAIDPIHQFQIHAISDKISLFGVDVSFTNSALFMVVAVALIALVMLYGTSERKLVPGRLQAAAEIFYEFVADTVTSTTGKDGLRFLPLVFSLFMFVLVCNFVGLIPGTFTVPARSS